MLVGARPDRTSWRPAE